MASQMMPAIAQKPLLMTGGENRPRTRAAQTREPQPRGMQEIQNAPDEHPRSSILDELAGEIGMDAAAGLVDIFGGTRLYIPHSPDEDDLLTAAIGQEAASKLARIYGGDRIEVPNPTPRRTRIIELRETGCSVDAIARKLGCTRRRVFQVLAEARAKQRA